LSWQRVKGHDDVVAAFARAVDRSRLAHGYLFTGPPGVGKRLFATELAKALLCESPPAGRFDSCDRCSSCRLVDAGTHPDVFVVRRAEEKNEVIIDDVRELSNNLAQKPARGGRKIAVLDDADDLNEHSANSFLKTLEEPFPGSLLILIGTSAERQLPTIRSRCQVVPFAALPEATVRDLLGTDADLDPATIGRLARLSDGSPGLARALADPGLWTFRNELFEVIAKPSPDFPALARRLQALVEEVGKEAGMQRPRASLIVRLLVDGFRQALSLSVDAMPAADSSDVNLFGPLAKKLGADGLLRRLERCLEADVQIDRRVPLTLVLEALMDALSYD
jgi:DNA polymerase III subunit delta'